MQTKYWGHGLLACCVLGAGFFAGYSYAQHKLGKELELHAVVNANSIVGVLLHLEKGDVDFARAGLLHAADSEILVMKDYRGFLSDNGDVQFKLDTLRRVSQFRKKYPQITTPETMNLRTEIDAYLAQELKSSKGSASQ